MLMNGVCPEEEGTDGGRGSMGAYVWTDVPRAACEAIAHEGLPEPNGHTLAVGSHPQVG
jgi:hypothetical protein